jgi:hypothetical protein
LRTNAEVNNDGGVSVHSAVSYALERCVELSLGIHNAEKATCALRVHVRTNYNFFLLLFFFYLIGEATRSQMDDFELALTEERLAFGADHEQLSGGMLAMGAALREGLVDTRAQHPTHRPPLTRATPRRLTVQESRFRAHCLPPELLLHQPTAASIAHGTLAMH